MLKIENLRCKYTGAVIDQFMAATKGFLNLKTLPEKGGYNLAFLLGLSLRKLSQPLYFF